MTGGAWPARALCLCRDGLAGAPHPGWREWCPAAAGGFHADLCPAPSIRWLRSVSCALRLTVPIPDAFGRRHHAARYRRALGARSTAQPALAWHLVVNAARPPGGSVLRILVSSSIASASVSL